MSLCYSISFPVLLGTGLPLPCRGGYYCGDHTGLPTGQCHPGYYCIGGLSSPTPVNVSRATHLVMIRLLVRAAKRAHECVLIYLLSEFN